MDISGLLDIYAMGFFPMAESREGMEVNFYAPEIRALLPIKDLHVSRRLRRTILQFPFTVKVDTAFQDVITACANARDATWINDTIIETYTKLHEAGYAHSVECWDGGRLIGGLYGVSLGGTFCGESMFSQETNASKIALVHLCARLHRGGYHLLDSQFRNPHLDQFGLYEMPQEDYVQLMQSHLTDKADFDIGLDERESVSRFLNQGE